MMIIYIIVSPFFSIRNISIWRRNDEFDEEVYPGFLLLDPMFNLVKFTKELYIFNLTEEIEEKHGQFILKGEMHKNQMIMKNLK